MKTAVKTTMKTMKNAVKTTMKTAMKTTVKTAMKTVKTVLKTASFHENQWFSSEIWWFSWKLHEDYLLGNANPYVFEL